MGSLRCSARATPGSGLGPRIALLVAALVFFAVSVSGCRQVQAPAPSLVLITIDQLSADHLACFGGPPENGKSLCRLADDGTALAWTISPGRGLASSLASVLTGMPESVHGMDDRGLSFLPDAQTTIAEALARQGYRTAAFVTSPALNRSRRIDQGFDQYESFAKAESQLPRAVERFVASDESPFFLWIHLTHHSAGPAAGGLADLDRSVAELGGILRRDGRDPALLLCALRGLPFEVPGIGLASHRVPMIWRPPTGQSARSLPGAVFELTSLLDVAPTLAGAAGLADAFSIAVDEDDAHGWPIGGPGFPKRVRFLLLEDPTDEEVGLVSESFFYVRSKSELDGTGQPVQSPDLVERSARFVIASKSDGENDGLSFTPWREDVLAADSPVPRLEFHLARLLQERSVR